MASSDLLLNRVFDRRYLIRRKLGSGGMADVYLADDQELGRQVALKMLNERHATDEQFVERFRLEAQNAAGLNHPNIVSVFDRGQAEGTYYIAMEFLDGRTLKDLLIRNGPTPIPVAIDYTRQMLSALAFAHRNGIVHRDIKPHNIVVGDDGRLKVTDFGIARSGTSQMTEAGSIVGTAQYLSPEQARGAPVDPRSDLYSLGIVMYEMLTGTVPFTGDAPVEIAMKHLSAIPNPPSVLRPEVPHDLDAVVMRALAKEPDQRYASAEEMEADLARVARGVAVSPRTEEAMTQVLAGAGIAAAAATTVSPPRPATPPPAPAPPPYLPPGGHSGHDEPRRRRSWWPWLLGLLAVAIAAGAGYLLYQSIQSQLDQAQTIPVENIELLRADLAIQKLKAQGFQVTVVRDASDTVPRGAVISQDPVSGLKIARDSIVVIHVSTGKTTGQGPSRQGFLARAGHLDSRRRRPEVEPGLDLLVGACEHRHRAGSSGRHERRRRNGRAHQHLEGTEAGGDPERRREDRTPMPRASSKPQGSRSPAPISTRRSRKTRSSRRARCREQTCRPAPRSRCRSPRASRSRRFPT